MSEKKNKKPVPPRPTQKELMQGSGSWDAGRLGGIKGKIKEFPQLAYGKIWKSVRSALRRSAGTTPGYGVGGAGSAGVTSAMMNIGALAWGTVGQGGITTVGTNARAPAATQGISYFSYLNGRKRVSKSSRSRSKRRKKKKRRRSRSRSSRRRRSRRRRSRRRSRRSSRRRSRRR